MISINNLKIFYPKRKGLFNQIDYYVKAVNGVSFSIEKGKTYGLVGESGCGKSSIGKALVGLTPLHDGELKIDDLNIVKTLQSNRKEIAKRIQLIFQDPYGSLNPKMMIGTMLDEAVSLAHSDLTSNELKNKSRYLLEKVGLNAKDYNKYPHEFSGGQRQRIGIARALGTEPEFIICDECVSALDVSIQASVINLLKDLQDEFKLTYLFISHDLSVVRYISHKVGIMYLGELVEEGTSEEVFSSPKHPYTKALIDAIPNPDPLVKKQKNSILGDIPSPVNLPTGCYFKDRCPHAEGVCDQHPELVFNKQMNRKVRCLLIDKIN